MTRSLTVISSAALLGLACASCSAHSPQRKSSDEAATDCMCAKSLVQWSQAELQEKTAAAKRGDAAAQKDLWSYYLAHEDKRNASYWEERLFQAGDMDAIDVRASRLFGEAHDLEDRDPRKLSLLKLALELEGRERRARTGSVAHVMVNGKEIEVRFSGKPDERTENYREELARVAALHDR